LTDFSFDFTWNRRSVSHAVNVIKKVSNAKCVIAI
jgi:hypothetical protein